MSPNKISRWFIVATSATLAAIGYRLHPGYNLPVPAPAQVEPVRYVTVPIIPYIGTRAWRELGQPEDKLRERMGPPVIRDIGDGLNRAYAGSYPLVETGGPGCSNDDGHGCTVYGLDFDFNVIQEKVNVAATLTYNLGGRSIRLNHQTTPTQLAQQFDCDGSRPGYRFTGDPSRNTDLCRLASPTQENARYSTYYVLGAGIRCTFSNGHLQSVYLNDREYDLTDHLIKQADPKQKR